MESEEARDYHAFLLRMRRVQVDGRPAWRFSLHAPGEADARKFPTLAALEVFLDGLMGEIGRAPGRDRTGGLDRDEQA